MLKYFKVFGLFVILGIMPVWVYGSESSPWGVVAVWESGKKDTTIEWWKFPSMEQESPPDRWRHEYCPQLDSMKTCGLTWNRPNCSPAIEISDGFFDYSRYDSLVTFMQERDLNLCAVTWPLNIGAYTSLPDSEAWVRYWKNVVERYNGNSINDMPGLTKPVRHWNISNDAGMHYWVPPAAPGPDPSQGTMEDFRKYTRISYEAIHNIDTEAKVIAPSGAPFQTFWVNSPSDTDYISPDSFWSGILGDNGAQYIDIISAQYLFHDLNPANFDNFRAILDRHGAAGKPIWITEEGGMTDTIATDTTVTEEMQAKYYMEFCRQMLIRDWPSKGNKVFFFTLKDFPVEYGILHTDYTHKPAFDSLCKFIFFTSEHENITAHNNQRKLAVDRNGNLHLVTSSYGDIHYAVSSDNGQSWMNTYVVGDGEFPAIAIDDADGINVCWIADDGLHYRRKTAMGWEDDVLLFESGDRWICAPSIAADKDTVHIVIQYCWMPIPDPAYYRVDYLKFPITNPTDTSMFELDSWAGAMPPPIGAFPSIGLTRGLPYVCWEKDGEIRYRYHSGIDWSDVTVVSEPSIPAHHPSLEVWHDPWIYPSRSVHIVWQGEDNQIYHRRGSITLTPPDGPPHDIVG